MAQYDILYVVSAMKTKEKNNSTKGGFVPLILQNGGSCS